MNKPSKTKLGDLKLSAIRAFMGKINSNVRLIKVNFSSSEKINLTVVFEQEPKALELEDVEEASTEIIADFPECTIEENVVSNRGDIRVENLVSEGWIFRRYEPIN